MTKNNCGIYKITNTNPNKKTGVCKIYVGSAYDISNRKRRHFRDLKNNKHTNQYLQNAYNIDGENFKWEIIKEIEKIKDKKLLKEELLKWEQYYLNKYVINEKIDWDKCYNLSPTAGSPLGYKHTKEAKINMSRATKGIVKSEEHRINLSISHKGKKHTKEHRINNSIAKKGNHPTEETRKKMSESHKGKISYSKKVINLDTNKKFNSIKEAAEFYNIQSSDIVKICKGQIKNSKKGTWRYL